VTRELFIFGGLPNQKFNAIDVDAAKLYPLGEAGRQ
jgi:hypothetical protein